MVILLIVTQAVFGAIFGIDDRQDWDDWDQNTKKLAQSVSALIPKENLHNTGQGFVLKEEEPTYGEHYGLCPGVRFFKQKNPSYCTAFLIAPMTLLTAAHCLNENNLNDFYLVFNYIAVHNETRTHYEMDEVYEISKVKSLKEIDLAIITVNKNIPFEPLLFDIRDNPFLNEEVWMIGTPHGLPLKMSRNSTVQKQIFSDPILYFEADLDAFGGNSGSPVFNTSGEVLGIYVVGFGEFEPFQHSELGTCQNLRTFTKVDEAYGWILKSKVIKQHILRLLVAHSPPPSDLEKVD